MKLPRRSSSKASIPVPHFRPTEGAPKRELGLVGLPGVADITFKQLASGSARGRGGNQPQERTQGFEGQRVPNRG